MTALVGLERFLDLTPDQARRQWAAIKERRPDARADYLPVETLLCHGLSSIVDAHKFGGRNIHRLPEPVRVLARTLRRTDWSILNKMFNLDGSRAHGQRDEPALFWRLVAEPDRFDALYQVVLSGARAAGLDPDEVPDFLDKENGGSAVLLGQEEIGSAEMAHAMRGREDEIKAMRARTGLSEVETTRVVESRVRMGQDRFARATLANFGHRCGFCGFGPGHLRGNRLLAASHIKPWRDCADRERLDPRNGIAACPTHDAAFDACLLTVNGHRRIHVSGALARLAEGQQEARRLFAGPTLAPTLVIPPGASPPGEVYLAHHNARFRAVAS